MIALYACYITDGTTTLNLYGEGGDYVLTSFAPVIAPLQTSQMAAGGPYRAVQQSLNLNIFGDTPTACWDNLTRLIRLIAQADYWASDMPVAAVRFCIQTAETATLVETLILGDVSNTGHVSGSGQVSSSGSDLSHSIATLEPEPVITPQGSRYALQGVDLTFLRSGVWEATVEATVTLTSTTPPVAMTGTFATNSRTYSRIRIAGNRASGSGTGGFMRDNVYAFLLLVSDDLKLNLLDSATLSTPALTSNVADAAADAYGGSVKRCQASTTEIQITYPIAWATPKRRVGIFAAVRNNSASVSFFLRGEVTDLDNAPNRTPYVEIDTSTVLPRIVYVGLVTSRYDVAAADNFSLYVSATTTSGAQTLDIDYVVLVCLDDIWADRIIAFGNTLSASGKYVSPLVIEPGSSVLRTPYPLSVATLDSGGTHATMPRGDIYTVATGQEIAAMILTTNGDTIWRLHSSVNNVDPTNITLRRSRAYLTPPGATEP